MPLKVTENDKYNRKLVYYVDNNNFKEGRYISYHTNNKEFEEITYKRNQKHGDYRCRYDSSQLYIRTEYRDDLLDGRYTSYYPNGNNWIDCYYKEGLLHGTYEKRDVDGNKWIKIEYKQGRIVKVITLRDDEDRDCVLDENNTYEVWTNGEANKTNVYIKILVPKDVERVTLADPNSCRSKIESGKVLEIIDEHGRQYKEADSDTKHFVVGQLVHADEFSFSPEKNNKLGISVYRHREHCSKYFMNLLGVGW
jgi:antitoxin component YwqK of YwqJK toxin-antitoxin module